ncbi:MAG: lipoprotein-releasing system permease protein [Chlamydiales bacterium]
MYRSFLSLRYLKRRRTNWIGTAGIAIAVAALILILSIMSGFLAESRGILRGSLADLIIQPRQGEALQDGSLIPTRPARLLEAIRSDERVAGACPQIQHAGLVNIRGRGNLALDPRRRDFQMVQLIGIDPQDEYQATELRTALEASSLYNVARPVDVDDPFAVPPEYDPRELDERPLERVILGEQLALAWQLGRGDVIDLVTMSQQSIEEGSQPSNQRYVVAGMFRSGDNEMDAGRIYMDRPVLADLIGEGDYFTHILVKLVDYERDSDVIVGDLNQTLAKQGLLHEPRFDYGRMSEIKTWEQFKQVFLAAVENEKSLMGIMLSLVMIVAGFTVFALLSMMVSEKRRDIGIISALGGTPTGILSVFLLIAFWQALVGTLLGATAGVWAAIKIDSIERWLSSTFGIEIFDRNVYYFDHIPSVIEPYGVAIIMLGAFGCTLLFAAIPALRAARMHPIDALRYE